MSRAGPTSSSTTLWPFHSTHGVYSGGQRGQTDGFTEGYNVPPNLSPVYPDFGSSLSRTRLTGEQGEIRTGSKTGFQRHRLPV